MTEGILGIVAAVVSIVAMILRAKLSKVKTEGERIAEESEVVADRASELAKKIQDGKVYDVVTEMDDLARRCRMLRMHASKNPRDSSG